MLALLLPRRPLVPAQAHLPVHHQPHTRRGCAGWCRALVPPPPSHTPPPPPSQHLQPERQLRPRARPAARRHRHRLFVRRLLPLPRQRPPGHGGRGGGWRGDDARHSARVGGTRSAPRQLRRLLQSPQCTHAELHARVFMCRPFSTQITLCLAAGRPLPGLCTTEPRTGPTTWAMQFIMLRRACPCLHPHDRRSSCWSACWMESSRGSTRWAGPCCPSSG